MRSAAAPVGAGASPLPFHPTSALRHRRAPPIRAAGELRTEAGRRRYDRARVGLFDRVVVARPAGRAAVGRAARLGALHRRRRRSTTRARVVARAERRGQVRHGRRARRGDPPARRGAGDRRRLPRRARRRSRTTARRERVGQAHGPRAQARPRTSAASLLAGRRCATPRRAARSCGSTWRTRPASTTRSPSTASCAAAGLDNVGIVLQACLQAHARGHRRARRPAAERAPVQGDLRRAGQDRVPGRRTVVRRSFVACLEALLAGGSRVGVATHDERADRRVARAGGGAPPRGLRAPDAARRARGAGDASSSPPGHRLRVYVPYGQRWYEYSLRRLQENPQMAGMIAKATLGRMRRPTS